MDVGHDSGLLCSHVCRPYIHHRNCHRSANHFVQRGHRHLLRTGQRQESPLDQIPQLVLSSHDDVLPLRGKRHLLLQTHSPC